MAGAPEQARPATPEQAAAVMGRCGAEGRRLRIRGGGTKLGWGRPAHAEPDMELCTAGLDRVIEHNAGDLTAVLQAGVPLASAQAAFAEAGQMLALDPPLGSAGQDTAGATLHPPLGSAGPDASGATVGGLVATADSGPLRHRYGGVRDLVVGITVALSDGTLARAGGKVIKNVAGYDLGKLFAGSFGTLGLIVEVAVRLHPRPARTATAVGRSADPASLQRGASAVAHAPVEADCLDVAWNRVSGVGAGAVLARFASANPGPRVEEAAGLLRGAGLDVEIVPDDEDAGLWDDQRAGQRAEVGGAVVKVSALQGGLADVLRAADGLSAGVVGRAGLGLAWVRLPEGPAGDLAGAIEELRRRLAPSPCVVLDAPAEVRSKIDPWGEAPPAVELMRRVKARFDPAGVCQPGIFVGGI
jgi:glycolate oxidase FAD binding subunit